MVIFEDSQALIQVTIEDVVLKELYSSSTNAYPNETGGFLVGRYITNRHALIEQLVKPVESKSNQCCYERSTDGMKELWDALFTTGHIYLGEWHTHPNGSCNYSRTDLEAICSIASSRDVNIIRPLLMILSISQTGVKKIHLYHYDTHSSQLIKLDCKLWDK